MIENKYSISTTTRLEASALMSPSDIEHISDSDDDHHAKKSNVYLAFVDTPVKDDEGVVIEDTFIGGEPVWLAKDSIPSYQMLQCGTCKNNKNMRLLLQAFAPLDFDQVQEVQQNIGHNNKTGLQHVDENDDRVLYVFMCMSCQRQNNSVKVIRGVRKSRFKTENGKGNNSTSSKKSVAEIDEKDNPFNLESHASTNPFSGNNGSVNPFSGDKFSVDSTHENKSHTKEEKISAKAAKKLYSQSKDRHYDTTKTFPCFHLFVEEESFKNKPDHLQLPKNLKISKEALDLTGNDDIDLEKDPVKLDPRTEKLSRFLDDDIFQKFQEIVGYNPSQVLRYELGGKPLLFAESPIDITRTIARPSYNPSSQRVFELQLMPKMILDLEVSASFDEGMEWGTIMIFTDIENFTPDIDDNGVGYVEEVAKVQWEPKA